MTGDATLARLEKLDSNMNRFYFALTPSYSSTSQLVYTIIASLNGTSKEASCFIVVNLSAPADCTTFNTCQ